MESHLKALNCNAALEDEWSNFWLSNLYSDIKANDKLVTVKTHGTRSQSDMQTQLYFRRTKKFSKHREKGTQSFEYVIQISIHLLIVGKTQ